MKLLEGKRTTTTFSAERSNRRAADERARLFEGLERIVNASDSETDRNELALAAPSFWPVNIITNEGSAIRWETASWALFIAYRDYLRRVWIGDFRKKGDDNTLLDGVYLNYLLGLDVDFARHEPGEYIDARLPDRAFTAAWATLKKKFPGAYVNSWAIVVPAWVSGQFFHVPTNDFQEAVQALLLESWRARTCRGCRKYFIADKNAQAYCSTGCSGGSRLTRGLKYWREKGSSRRAKKKLGGRRKK